jgi:hypothetical protein
LCIFKPAKTAAILSTIRGLSCSILENALDDFFEKRWESIYQNFIEEVKNGVPVTYGQSEIRISSNTAKSMLEFFFMMLCRSPKFDAMGIHKNMKENILVPVVGNEQIVEDLMMGAWYAELYRSTRQIVAGTKTRREKRRGATSVAIMLMRSIQV